MWIVCNFYFAWWHNHQQMQCRLWAEKIGMNLMPIADPAFLRALQVFYISYWPSKTIRYSVVSKYDQTTVIQSELVWIQFSIGIVKYCLRKGLRGWDTWNRSSTWPSHLSKVIITVSTHTSFSIFCLSTCKIFHTKDCGENWPIWNELGKIPQVALSDFQPLGDICSCNYFDKHLKQLFTCFYDFLPLLFVYIQIQQGKSHFHLLCVW